SSGCATTSTRASAAAASPWSAACCRTPATVRRRSARAPATWRATALRTPPGRPARTPPEGSVSHPRALARPVGMSTRTTHSTPTTHVLIVGAGFAGGMAAVRLAGRSRGRVAVTVVNPRPTFVNRLRLHQLAAGQQVPAPSIRRMLGPDVTFVEGYVTSLDPDGGRATVHGPDGVRQLLFDRAVLATGSTTEPVPVPGGEHTHGVADLAAAERLRHAVASLPAGADVAVVGGGFT